MNNSSSARGLDYDTETGEVNGQLLFGFAVPTMPVVEAQRCGHINTTREHFWSTRWDLDEGDSMTVKVKDGRWLVTIKKAWEQMTEPGGREYRWPLPTGYYEQQLRSGAAAYLERGGGAQGEGGWR